jgi:hypothetical protein
MRDGRLVEELSRLLLRQRALHALSCRREPFGVDYLDDEVQALLGTFAESAPGRFLRLGLDLLPSWLVPRFGDLSQVDGRCAVVELAQANSGVHRHFAFVVLQVPGNGPQFSVHLHRFLAAVAVGSITDAD